MPHYGHIITIRGGVMMVVSFSVPSPTSFLMYFDSRFVARRMPTTLRPAWVDLVAVGHTACSIWSQIGRLTWRKRCLATMRNSDD